MFDKLISFGVIGLFNAVLDTGIWKTLTIIFEKSPKIKEILSKIGLNIYSGAQIFSFAVAVLSSFILNSTFTWKAKNPFGSSKQIILYFAVSIFTWCLTILFLNMFTNNMFLSKYNKLVLKIENEHFMPSIIKKHVDYPLIIKVLSIGISMLSNFVGYNYIVFSIRG